MSNKKSEHSIQKLAIQFVENHNERTFQLLVDRINWGLRKYIFNIVNNNSAVDEILSKTLENIYFKYKQFDPSKANFSTWMYKIAYNNTLKYIQERDKYQNSTCSEDISDIYDSELRNVSDERDDRAMAVGDDLIDILFKNNTVEVYEKERVLTEIYDASVECIQSLPDNLRIVIYERFINSKKIEDIAIDNNIPISSVKNWLRRGKIVLEETVKERYATLYNMYTNSEN